MEEIKALHLKDLLKDVERSAALVTEHSDIVLDYSRQNATPKTLVTSQPLITIRSAFCFTNARVSCHRISSLIWPMLLDLRASELLWQLELTSTPPKTVL